MMKLEALSTHRLNGEPVPADLAALVPYADELARRSRMRMAFELDWAPWADWSYIKDPNRPDIRANIKAHEMVFPYVAFFAEHASGEYLGYWRGPGMHLIAESRYVMLDNEGQYSLFERERTAASIIADACDDSVRAWLESLDVGVHNERVIEGDDWKPRPGIWHGQWFKKFMSSSD